MAEHEMKIRVMKTVSEGTKEIILGRTRKKELEKAFLEHSALALLHGDVCDLIYASDLAQKASGVEVFEIPGSCPQHLTCLGILGDVSAVDAAVQRIKKEICK
ncbi:MAG: BMC domain-containing protein [Oliverpabstia sp.]